MLLPCCVAGKDLFWYNRDKGDMGVTQDELEAVKAREREMMAEVSHWEAATPSLVVAQLVAGLPQHRCGPAAVMTSNAAGVWWGHHTYPQTCPTQALAAAMLPPCAVFAQALGLKPKAAPSTRSQPALEKHEVERLLKGGGDEQDAAPAGAAEADRIKGLGFQSG